MRTLVEKVERLHTDLLNNRSFGQGQIDCVNRVCESVMGELFDLWKGLGPSDRQRIHGDLEIQGREEADGLLPLLVTELEAINESNLPYVDYFTRCVIGSAGPALSMMLEVIQNDPTLCRYLTVAGRDFMVPPDVWDSFLPPSEEVVVEGGPRAVEEERVAGVAVVDYPLPLSVYGNRHLFLRSPSECSTVRHSDDGKDLPQSPTGSERFAAHQFDDGEDASVLTNGDALLSLHH